MKTLSPDCGTPQLQLPAVFQLPLEAFFHEVTLLNVAVTVLSAVTVTVQVVPEHPGSDQVTEDEHVSKAAVRVTDVPDVYGALQVAPQLIPDGELVIVPVPVFVTVRVNVGFSVVKLHE
jgi:hypothetical protein